jgi:hypothetical protein
MLRKIARIIEQALQLVILYYIPSAAGGSKQMVTLVGAANRTSTFKLILIYNRHISPLAPNTN